MRHEESTEAPPLSPEEERAVLAQEQIHEQQVLAEAEVARYQGHPAGCFCIHCAAAIVSVVTRGMGGQITPLNARPLESSPRGQRILDRSHEGAA